jgi:hypothetical protein
VVVQADKWQDFHNGFMNLADIQERIARATRKDFLFADCEFADPEFDSIPKGPCCLLPTLESAAILGLREGPDEHLTRKIHDFRNTEGLVMVQIRYLGRFETKNEAFT